VKYAIEDCLLLAFTPALAGVIVLCPSSSLLATATAKEVREGEALCITSSFQDSFCDATVTAVFGALGVFNRIRVVADAFPLSNNIGEVGGDGKAECGISGGLISGASSVKCVGAVGWSGEDMVVVVQLRGQWLQKIPGCLASKTTSRNRL